MIKIAIDCLGGDHSPDANIDGTLAALNKHSDLCVVLFGDESVIKSKLEGKKYDKMRVEIYLCACVGRFDGGACRHVHSSPRQNRGRSPSRVLPCAAHYERRCGRLVRQRRECGLHAFATAPIRRYGKRIHDRYVRCGKSARCAFKYRR